MGSLANYNKSNFLHQNEKKKHKYQHIDSSFDIYAKQLVILSR